MQSIKIFVLFAVLALASVNAFEFDRQLKMGKSNKTYSPNAKLGKGVKSEKCGKSGKYGDESCAPSGSPSISPSAVPTLSAAPSNSPSKSPSAVPTLSAAPSGGPTIAPTKSSKSGKSSKSPKSRYLLRF